MGGANTMQFVKSSRYRVATGCWANRLTTHPSSFESWTLLEAKPSELRVKSFSSRNLDWWVEMRMESVREFRPKVGGVQSPQIYFKSTENLKVSSVGLQS